MIKNGRGRRVLLQVSTETGDKKWKGEEGTPAWGIGILVVERVNRGGAF